MTHQAAPIFFSLLKMSGHLATYRSRTCRDHGDSGLHHQPREGQASQHTQHESRAALCQPHEPRCLLPISRAIERLVGA